MKMPASRLRRVVRIFVNETYSRMEELECGHIVRVKQDIYGYTNAYQRRCTKCRQEEMAAKGGLEPPTS